MSTHIIQFYDKIRNLSLIFVFLCYQKNFVGSQKRVQISHGKQAICVRTIKVRLYLSLYFHSLYSRRLFHCLNKQERHRSD